MNIEQYMPKDRLMAMGYVDCLRWSINKPEVAAAFREDTGLDETSENVGEEFVKWFTANIWGKE